MPMKPIRVLIASGDPVLARTLAREIERDERSLVVGFAHHSDEAIRIAILEQPDVAIVGPSLPGIGVPRAVRTIRAECPRSRLLAISRDTAPAQAFALLRAGASGYIDVEASPEEIREVVRSAASGGGLLSSDSTTRGPAPDRSSARNADEGRDAPTDHEAERVRAILARKAFFLVFQPIVDLVERRTVGLEALSRFPVEPVRGPDAWFAAAQAAGLGLKLELAAAGAALARLSQVPDDLFVSVNLSPATVTSPALLRALSGRSGSRVVAEITEHAAVEDYGPLRLALAEIKALGVRFANDDVGSGFASLRHLLRLRPDFIKLDGLVSQHALDPAGRALVSGIVSYATEVGATVIAEGIETPGQLDALQRLGVKHGQGFLLGGPTYLPRAGRKGTGISARSPRAAPSRAGGPSLGAPRARAL